MSYLSASESVVLDCSTSPIIWHAPRQKKPRRVRMAAPAVYRFWIFTPVICRPGIDRSGAGQSDQHLLALKNSSYFVLFTEAVNRLNMKVKPRHGDYGNARAAKQFPVLARMLIQKTLCWRSIVLTPR
jgi:hypothetical protein